MDVLSTWSTKSELSKYEWTEIHSEAELVPLKCKPGFCYKQIIYLVNPTISSFVLLS